VAPGYVRDLGEGGVGPGEQGLGFGVTAAQVTDEALNDSLLTDRLASMRPYAGSPPQRSNRSTVSSPGVNWACRPGRGGGRGDDDAAGPQV